ncbi:MAG: sporulation protein YqfD [Peptococcaceae bacterium]|nr:sporulation protein YqfD [Peptococcaceae bacterium]
MNKRSWALMVGELQVQVKGEGRLEFLNTCQRSRIPLWGVKVSQDCISLATSIRGFLAMRKPARRHRCLVRVVGRRGFPFFWQRLRRRTSFALGALIFLSMVWLFSNFVWQVDISPSVLVSREQIFGVAKEHGLYVGAWREKIKPEEVRMALLLAFPNLAFVSVDIEGSRVEINIVDRDMVKIAPRPAGDIRARKGGLITRIIAFSGQALVSHNTTVVAGQMLIAGEVVVNGYRMPPVHAAGIAEARVWYEAIGHSSLNREVRVYTGVVATGNWIRVGGVMILQSGPGASPFTYYDVVTHKRIVAPFVEHITVTYREQDIEAAVASPQQAVAEAKSQADTQLRGLVPEEATLVEKNYHELWSADGQRVMVRMILETIEDIGDFVAHAGP